jgi:predicted porin
MATITPYLGAGNNAGTCGNAGAGALTCPTNALNATITDNEAFSVMAKYTYEFGGGFKDEGPSSKLTFFAGYVHMELSNPDSAVAPDSFTAGGYQMFTVNNQPYALGSDRVLQTEWGGAKYDMGPWAFTGAYYHLSQDAFVAGPGVTASPNRNCAQGTAHNVATAGYVGRTIGSQCSGETNTVSGLVDYTFNKHFDMYAGVAWSDVSGGLSNGFVGGLDNTTFMTGLRLKF